MTAKRHSLLHLAFDGPETGEPWLILHDRHGSLAAARMLGETQLAPDTRRIAVRSARTQTRGSLAPPKGNFWFIGPLHQPELSTLGDALYQLDRLLNDMRDIDGHSRLNLLGQGEGGTVALLLALLRPDMIGHVVAMNASFPRNFSRMPMQIGDVNGLTVLLSEDDGVTATELMRIAPGLAVSVHGNVWSPDTRGGQGEVFMGD
ncbi:hypothetical protein G6L29_31130 [Agrobacterium rhizogenes]|uniref:Phospholipase/carboxylesterase/thioesterase domain-containing protein n=1 Tax=Rhizobium rhizogenes NBRC 13257 TaxID=1220581 RepID=A0AA87QF44_RHIRH|nr:hypothetical protein [Rhizobium rhizogenes]NTG65103.1 hypothetical protein [Rhizobium rhizogenes]NTG71554.1 hypothetical protein [Rhizobium rhizogenes]NTG84453.1 hypothetical protein [Rhizobium rhizogenes]NTG90847.1 hypothetical protein [Rhizobium rhizogenes]NTH29481.1 hypothetical protein [Rhizobium rhizogenes]